MEERKQGYRVLFEVLGAICVALTAFIVGYSVSSGQWEANISALGRNNGELQRKLDTWNEQISS